ncbi:MAG TPA: vWA domain-containing protein [Polyangia bacterium]
MSALSGLACNKADVRSTPSGGGGAGETRSPGAGGGSGLDARPIALPEVGAEASSTSSSSPPDAPATCAGESFEAQTVPVDLLLVVDTSRSMLFPSGPMGTKLKWEAMAKSLMGFVRDPRSSGMGVGLSFFPVNKTCTTARDCPVVEGPFGSSALCLHRHVCWGPAGVTSPGLPCDAENIGYPCPTGSTCQPVGTCSLSGSDCPNIGQPCPGNEGTCTAVSSTCLDAKEEDTCAVTSYSRPVVPIAGLPGAEPMLLRSLADRYPMGGTPLGPAVEGALAYLRPHATAHPGRRVLMVVATDGVPSGCSNRNTIAAIAEQLRVAQSATPGISTFLIGVFAPYEIAMAEPELNRLAVAGGTGKPFLLTATEDLPMKLQEALASIRGVALACEYKIPSSKTGAIDFMKVNVRHSPGTQSATGRDLPYVGRADRCDPARGGWYYDVEPAQGTPSLIRICEASCREFRADARGRVDLVFGCATQIID